MLSHIQQAEHFLTHGHYVKADSIYRLLLSQNKSNGEACLGLGNIAFALNQFDEAVLRYTQACHLLPGSILPLQKLANAFNSVCSEQDALTVLEYAYKQFPQSAQIIYLLAQQHLMTGNVQQAEKLLRVVLSKPQSPISAHALFELVRMKCYTIKDVNLIQQRLEIKTISESEQTVLYYALGNIYHNAKEFESAWRNLYQANILQIKKCDFSCGELNTFFNEIKKLATKEVLAQQNTANEGNIIPIFIVGLPRSGSTLLEQMLARHPCIAAGGELPYLSREVDHFLYHKTGHHYPYSMQNLSDELMQQAANVYLLALKRHARNKPYVIDKLPANFQSLGMIHKLFPSAKIIHIKRHSPAVAFSIFRNYFAANEPYFCSLEEFERYQTYYLDLMSHWHNVMSGSILDIRYEQLVNQPKQILQSALAFCGLDWDTACLSHTLVETPITTLSNLQARRPIEMTTNNDWQPYTSYLQPFLNINSEIKAALNG